MTTEKKTNKKATWKRDGDNATITFPDGTEKTFDFSKLDDAVFAYYGKKQFLGDGVAGVAQAEKSGRMQEIYDEVTTNGVELSEDGRIRVIGRTRSNERNNDAKTRANVKTAADAQSVLNTHKMGLLKLSAEYVVELQEIAAGKKTIVP